MHFLTMSVCLSLFSMTHVTAADLDSELRQPPLSESVYLFIVQSDADITAVKESFNGIDQPRHSFRVIGENVYIFVMASNDTQTLRQLTFPEGSSVTQFPVEHIADYQKMFGIDSGYEENDTYEALPDAVLTFNEWEYDFPKGTPVNLFDLMISSLATDIKPTHRELKPLIYVPIAYYPLKLFDFSAVDDNALQHFAKSVQNLVGGIGILKLKVKHVVKI